MSKVFFKATISKNKSTFYITITDVSEGYYAYKFVNKCENVDVFYSQATLETNQGNEEYLPYEDPTPFAWPHPSLQPILAVRFQVKGQH